MSWKRDRDLQNRVMVMLHFVNELDHSNVGGKEIDELIFLANSFIPALLKVGKGKVPCQSALRLEKVLAGLDLNVHMTT